MNSIFGNPDISKADPVPEHVQKVIDTAIEGARGNFKGPDTVMACLLVLMPDKSVNVIGFPAVDKDMNHTIGRMIDMFLSAGCHIAHVTEAWVATPRRGSIDPDNIEETTLAPRLDPERREVVMINVFFPNGRRILICAMIELHLNAPAVLGEFKTRIDSSIRDHVITPCSFEKDDE